MRTSRPSTGIWYLAGAFPGALIALLLTAAFAQQFTILHPGEEYDERLRSIINVVYAPLAGIGGALVGIVIVALIRAPRVAMGWLTLAAGAGLVLAMLPIRAEHGWPIALIDLLVGFILIGIGLKTAK